MVDKKSPLDIPLDEQLKIHDALSECMVRIVDQVSPKEDWSDIGTGFLVLGIFAGNLVCLLNDENNINITAEQITLCGNNLLEGFMKTASLNLKKPALVAGEAAHQPLIEKGSDLVQ